ncbi:MAG: DUF4010 domain-containing protein [Actinomycetota bacterium]|nr:DUF4010 domain-containing protein [Actinomycetota bacterium]
MELSTITPFIEATALGLGVGLEREWDSRDGGELAAGSRTFALVGLLGCVAASLGPYMVAAGLLAVGAIGVVAYMRTAVKDIGATTEVALVLTYAFGALVWQNAQLALGLAVVAVVLLASKSRIHGLTESWLSQVEVDDAIRFFVIAFVVLPVLPDRAMGPYGAINPYHVWILVVAMTGISWLGYIAVRLVGASKGTLVAGFAGGFISASATTASMGSASRQPGARKGVLLAGAIGASVATPVQLFLVLGVASPKVLEAMAAPLAVALTILVAEGALIFYLARDATRHDTDKAVPTGRPFSLVPALTLAALITVVLVASRWGAEVFGAAGTVLTTALAGFADAHAPILSAASLARAGSLSEHVAILAGSAALLTNTVTKAVLAFVSGGVRFGAPFAVLMAPPVAGFAIALFATGALT